MVVAQGGPATALAALRAAPIGLTAATGGATVLGVREEWSIPLACRESVRYTEPYGSVYDDAT
jgi:hypothetical protein